MKQKSKFIFKYRCRYCKEVFTQGAPVTEHVANEMLTTTMIPELLYGVHKAQYYSENPHLGLADFIGFEKISDEESTRYDKVDIIDSCDSDICSIMVDRHPQPQNVTEA